LIDRIASFSARHARAVIAVLLCLALAGEWRRRALSRDVIPELSDPKIALVADWMGHSALEVAEHVTSLLTGALRTVPGTTAVRGSSMAGMAYVDVSFVDGSDLERQRRALLEQLSSVREQLPSGVRLQVGPAAASTGWVFQYALSDPSRTESLLTLRRFQDDGLRPALRDIPGVAEVASLGGAVRELRVELQHAELQARGLAFSDALPPLEQALQAPGQQISPESLGQLALASPDGTPLQLGDVARVRVAADMPPGLADLAGNPAVVGGIVVARRDADLAPLVEQVRQTLQRKLEPIADHVQVAIVYDRLDLVSHAQRNLLAALAEEIAVVAAVILLFLLHPRSSLVPLITLPVVLGLTFLGMWLLDVPATIMSLGGIGIALGLAVDADVVALEACHRRLEAAALLPGHPAPQAGASDPGFTSAIFISLAIAALTFLPVFAFTGETGRLLQPLALTKTLVIGAALLVTLTLSPALRKLLVRGRVIAEFDHPLTRLLVRAYRPVVHFALARPWLTLTTAALALLSCLPIARELGSEFLPRVEEGDLLFMPTTLPGIRPEDAQRQLDLQNRIIAGFPEVESVFGKVGRAETATDPAPWSMAETTIRLAPRERWPRLPRARWFSSWAPQPLRRWLSGLWPEQEPRTMRELIEALDAATRLPGWASSWTAPARARLDMLATGVRTPVGLRIVAADGARLEVLGSALKEQLGRLAGTRSVLFESSGGEARLSFTPDAATLERFQTEPALAQSTAALFLQGGQVGDVEFEGRPARVRALPDNVSGRGDADRLRELTVRGANGPTPLALLGRTAHVAVPSLIRSEGGELVAYLYVDLTPESDVGSYVKAGQEQLADALRTGTLKLEPGERIEWTGQYALLQQGQRRLRWIVPVVLGSLLLLLFLQFRSWVHALIVLSSVPFALVGSLWTLHLLHYPLSAPVWVGLLSVVGLAMQTGVVMVVYIDDAFYRRVRAGQLKTRDDIVEAHTEGTVRRLRPKIMTISTMAAGLLPLLWSDGAGAEIMRRVAAPMLGGLLTSAFLTLEVLPVLYTIWRYRQLLAAQRVGLPIATLVLRRSQ
jgi:Cu(I)/Ag(I) efflux system membrane protein CusA/SilA